MKQKKLMLTQLQQDEISDTQPPNEETAKCGGLADDYERIQHREEILCKQRTRVKWLKKGDSNTKYSHQVVNMHW